MYKDIRLISIFFPAFLIEIDLVTKEGMNRLVQFYQIKNEIFLYFPLSNFHLQLDVIVEQY